MTPANKLAMYVGIIGVLTDLITNEPIDGSVDEIEEAMNLVGLNGRDLLYDKPLIESLQVVCKAFSEFKITSEVKKEIDEYNAAISEITE